MARTAPTLLAALLSAALLVAVPSAAQEQADEPTGAKPQDIAEIDGCLAAAAETGEDPAKRCIGLLSGACVDTPEGQTTVGMMTCMASETAAWDTILNDQWPKLMTQAREADESSQTIGSDRPSRAEALRAAQRAWIAFRDAECAHAYVSGGEGTIRTLLGASCFLNMTAGRVIDFHQRLSDQASR